MVSTSSVPAGGPLQAALQSWCHHAVHITTRLQSPHLQGIDIFSPKFNIVSPGADLDIYFPYKEAGAC